MPTATAAMTKRLIILSAPLSKRCCRSVCFSLRYQAAPIFPPGIIKASYAAALRSCRLSVLYSLPVLTGAALQSL
jgi:hypothetical protein